MSVAAARSSDLHPVTRYAVDVVDRRIVAGKPVLWQCRKHLDLLEHGEKRNGYYFDEDLASRPQRFFETQLTFVEGEKAREPFMLEDFQAFGLGYIFGWLRDDGFRLVREAWWRMARGNGKSPLASGVGLYCTGWDGFYGADGRFHVEERAQCFTAACKLEQTRAVMDTADLQVKGSPSKRLKARLEAIGGKHVTRIVDHETHSFFRALGRDSHTEDSWNPSLAIFDEVHAYGDAGMWNVFASAMVKRRQHLIFAITTAGFGGPNSFGMQQDAVFRRLIDPASRQTNDRVFVYIAEHDARVRCTECKGAGRGCEACDERGFTGHDPLTDERCWVMSNPNLGVSVQIDGLRARVEEAKIDKRKESDVRVKNFNEWQLAGDRAISEEAWDATGRACPLPGEAELKLRPCFMGLDLASTRDLNALDLYWPACGPWKTHVLKAWFWISKDSIPERKKRDGLDYQPWVNDGWIEATELPGGFTDQECIFRKAIELQAVYTIRKVGADRKFGEGLLPRLAQKGFEVERISQTHTRLAVPWQTFEKSIGQQTLAHGGNPVLREHAKSVVLVRDVDGLEIPQKGATVENIDGVAAALNAMCVSLTVPYEGPPAKIEHHKIPRPRGPAGMSIHSAFKVTR